MPVSFLGDSLLDTGNASRLAALFGLTLFPDPPYSEGKASNGLVLGEAVIAALGIDPESFILGFDLPNTSLEVNPLEENVNYGFAGASSGRFGSVSNNLGDLPVGLQSQAELFILDRETAAADSALKPEPDLILSAGSNDVFDVLVDIAAFAGVIATPTLEDDQALIHDLATTVVGNLQAAVITLQPVAGDIVIFGLPTLGDTPFALQTDGAVDALIPGDQAGQTRAFLTNAAAEINARLIDLYNGCPPLPDFLFDDLVPSLLERADALVDEAEIFLGGLVAGVSSLVKQTPWVGAFNQIVDDLFTDGQLPPVSPFLSRLVETVRDDLLGIPCHCDDGDDVLVIDGLAITEAGLAAWQNSLPVGLVPVTDLGYRDYLAQLSLGNPSNLPPGLVEDQFAFVDGVHPSNDLSQFLAAEIAPLIAAEFPDFGMG